jgi:polysaccharide pyruvyl transferase WcaK-like protein
VNRVVPVGYYGMQNYGDDLFRQTVLAEAQSLWPESRVRIFAPESPPYASQAGLRLSSAFASATSAGSALRSAAAAGGVAWGSTIALCGGSTLRFLSGTQRLYASLARHRSKEVEALGVSIGPFANSGDLRAVRSFATTFRRLVVRDRRSLDAAHDLLGRTDAVLGGDLAALYEMPAAVRDPDAFNVGIMPCVSAPGDSEAYVSSVVAAVRHAARRAGRQLIVTVFALNNNPHYGDGALATRLHNALVAAGLPAQVKRYIDAGVDETSRAIASLDLALTTRLHGAVVSYLAGVPFAFHEYQAKCGDFSADIHLPEPLRLPSGASASEWTDAVEAALSGERPRTTPLSYRTRAQRVYAGGLA